MVCRERHPGRIEMTIIVTLFVANPLSGLKSLIECFVSEGPHREVKAATNSHLHELLLREKERHTRTHAHDA